MPYADPEKQKQYFSKRYRENKEKKKQYNKEYYEKNKEVVLEKNKDWDKKNLKRRKANTKRWNNANPEKVRANQLKYKFWTPELWDKKYEEQGGVCEICKGLTTNGRKLNADHNHATKTPRGLLCNECNLMLGKARDNPALLEAGAQYLRKYSDATQEDK